MYIYTYYIYIYPSIYIYIYIYRHVCVLCNIYIYIMITNPAHGNTTHLGIAPGVWEYIGTWGHPIAPTDHWELTENLPSWSLSPPSINNHPCLVVVDHPEEYESLGIIMVIPNGTTRQTPDCPWLFTADRHNWRHAPDLSFTLSLERWQAGARCASSLQHDDKEIFFGCELTPCKRMWSWNPRVSKLRRFASCVTDHATFELQHVCTCWVLLMWTQIVFLQLFTALKIGLPILSPHNPHNFQVTGNHVMGHRQPSSPSGPWARLWRLVTEPWSHVMFDQSSGLGSDWQMVHFPFIHYLWMIFPARTLHLHRIETGRATADAVERTHCDAFCKCSPRHLNACTTAEFLQSSGVSRTMRCQQHKIY